MYSCTLSQFCIVYVIPCAANCQLDPEVLDSSAGYRLQTNDYELDVIYSTLLNRLKQNEWFLQILWLSVKKIIMVEVSLYTCIPLWFRGAVHIAISCFLM